MAKHLHEVLSKAEYDLLLEKAKVFNSDEFTHREIAIGAAFKKSVSEIAKAHIHPKMEAHGIVYINLMIDDVAIISLLAPLSDNMEEGVRKKELIKVTPICTSSLANIMVDEALTHACETGALCDSNMKINNTEMVEYVKAELERLRTQGGACAEVAYVELMIIARILMEICFSYNKTQLMPLLNRAHELAASITGHVCEKQHS